MLKFTRVEAVGRNTTVPLQIQQFGNDWSVWADSDKDGILDTTEKQILITGVVTLLPSGTPPSSASILAKLGATTSLDATKSRAAVIVTFDARGAVSPLAAYVLYLRTPNRPWFG